jgi:hypothetical protein
MLSSIQVTKVDEVICSSFQDINGLFVESLSTKDAVLHSIIDGLGQLGGGSERTLFHCLTMLIPEITLAPGIPR